MNSLARTPFTKEMKDLMVEYTIPGNVELVHIQEVIPGDLFLLKTHESVSNGFRGVLLSTRMGKIIHPGTKWFTRMQYENYEDIMDVHGKDHEHCFQVAIEGAMVHLFFYDGQFYISTNGNCQSVKNIRTQNQGSYWNFSYHGKKEESTTETATPSSNLFNIHRFVDSQLQGEDDNARAKIYGLEGGLTITLITHAKELLMCNQSTDMQYSHSLQGNRIFSHPYIKPFTFVGAISWEGQRVASYHHEHFAQVQFFDSVSEAIHFQRAITSQCWTESIGAPEDEILMLDRSTREVVGCLVTRMSEDRRLVCQGGKEESELMRNVFRIKGDRAFHIGYRVSQLMNLACIKELQKLNPLQYLTNTHGLGDTVSWIFLEKLLNRMDSLMADRSTKQADKLHHWFLHIVPIGFLLHGADFVHQDEFIPTEMSVRYLEFRGMDASAVESFSIRNERMMILACMLLNLFKAIPEELQDDMVEAVVQGLYERMYVCNLCFTHRNRTEEVLRNIQDEGLRERLDDRLSYLQNGLDVLGTRARKYRISSRVMELPPWRVTELFSNL